MHTTLVVVYSNTGICLRLARHICAERGWSLGTVKEARVRRGWRGILRCVADGWLHRTPPIRYEGPDVQAFDTVVLVSPVWAFRLAGPMRSFLMVQSARLREYAVLCVTGNHGSGYATAEIDHLTGRAAVLCATFTTREIDDGTCAIRLPPIVSALDRGGDLETPPPAFSTYTAWTDDSRTAGT